MTIEEFINATIPTTQPNEFGVYAIETTIEVVDERNKELRVRCAYNGKYYMFGHCWWRGTSGCGSPVSDRYSIKYTDIAHCDGTDCPLANKCRRFQLFKIWKEKEKKEYCLTPFVEPSFKNGKCEIFLRYERND